MKRVAFYAPIKPPNHPIASGDRLIARNLIAALEKAGYAVELASKFIAYSKRENAEILQQRKADALFEAKRLANNLKSSPPDIWVTYHPYCKAPDWIGPFVSQHLNIPYVTIEAAKTGQGFENGGDRWAHWRAEAQTGIKKADLHIAFKPMDIAYLESLTGDKVPIKPLKPFMNTDLPAPASQFSLPQHWRPTAPVLLTVGMMRPGKKEKNYELLAEALQPLQGLHWNLLVVGDGPKRTDIELLFGQFDQSRIHFCGAISHDSVLSSMKQADLFIWPGWKEPIGMVYLEAQLMGLPVAALDSMGVSLTVTHGETGLLAPENDTAKYTENLSMLISHPSLRSDFGAAAHKNIAQNHSLEAAAKRLKSILEHATKK